MNSLGRRKLLLTKFRYVARRFLLFFGTYNASSALTFAKSRQCLRISVQRVEKHLNPVPNWPSTVLRRMMRRNVTNVEICSKRQTLQGILRFIQAEVVCWHVKNVERTDVFRKHVNRFHGETAEHECGDCKKTFFSKMVPEGAHDYSHRSSTKAV